MARLGVPSGRQVEGNCPRRARLTSFDSTFGAAMCTALPRETLRILGGVRPPLVDAAPLSARRRIFSGVGACS